jgi:hypothetical protein
MQVNGVFTLGNINAELLHHLNLPHGPPMAFSGVKDLKVLKTTQSGYEGFLRDAFTLLPEVRDRIMATSVTATWKVRRAAADSRACSNACSALGLLTACQPPPEMCWTAAAKCVVGRPPVRGRLRLCRWQLCMAHTVAADCMHDSHCLWLC